MATKATDDETTNDSKECSKCHGHGKIMETVRKGIMEIYTSKVCDECNGNMKRITPQKRKLSSSLSPNSSNNSKRRKKSSSISSNESNKQPKKSYIFLLCLSTKI